MSAESTKEATAEGHKVTTVVEGSEASRRLPSPPESVAIFFDGEPMAGKAETWMTEHVADAATLQFVGPHALPLPLFDKAGFGSAMSNLVTSFPDLTFNATKVAPAANEDGSWAADIVVTGTHTGAAFTPMAGGSRPSRRRGRTREHRVPETFNCRADEAIETTGAASSRIGVVASMAWAEFDFHTGRQDRDHPEGGGQPARTARLLPRHRRRHFCASAPGRRCARRGR